MTDNLEGFKVKTPSDVWASVRELSEDRAALDIEFLRAPGKIWHAAMEQLDEASGTFYLRLPIPEASRQPAPTPVRISHTKKLVKIQFDTVATKAGPNGELYELMLQIPRNLYRIQRRTAFRISSCPDTPITIRASMDGRYWLRKNLHDVSVGGCSFTFDTRDMPMIKLNTIIPHVFIKVPDEEEIQAVLEVRTLAHPKSAPKPSVMKAGCRFVDLPFEQEATIQRFVNDAEQKQKKAG